MDTQASREKDSNVFASLVFYTETNNVSSSKTSL